jgi:hypothetical protein
VLTPVFAAFPHSASCSSKSWHARKTSRNTNLHAGRPSSCNTSFCLTARWERSRRRVRTSTSTTLYDLETDIHPKAPRAPPPTTIPDRRPFASSRFRSATLDDYASSKASTRASRDRRSVFPNPPPRAPPSTMPRTFNIFSTSHYSPSFVTRRHSQRRYQKHLVGMRSAALCD